MAKLTLFKKNFNMCLKIQHLMISNVPNIPIVHLYTNEKRNHVKLWTTGTFSLYAVL